MVSFIDIDHIYSEVNTIMSPERKTRVDKPLRCIQTRGLLAAMQALREWGPHASLDKVALIAGCPKASLARVFISKEHLLIQALAELESQSMQALRQEAESAGLGRAGAFAAASLASTKASDPSFRGCPLNAAAGSLSAYPWAEPIVRAHKCRMVSFYAELLACELPPHESLVMARAICLISDGVHINASAGLGPLYKDAALLALAALIGIPAP